MIVVCYDGFFIVLYSILIKYISDLIKFFRFCYFFLGWDQMFMVFSQIGNVYSFYLVFFDIDFSEANFFFCYAMENFQFFIGRIVVVFGYNVLVVVVDCGKMDIN